jgi:hypothetical protein
MRSALFIGAAIALAAALPGAAQGQDFGALTAPASIFDSVDEIRFGAEFHHVYPTLILADPSQLDFSRLEDVTFDVLFRSPELDAFRWIGSPRPDLGATISLTGHESFVHLGLTWQVHVFDTPVFVEGTLGGAANNGYADNAPVGYYNQGCPLGFYERVGIGVDLPSNMTLLVNYEHSSNWGLCSENRGMTNGGVKLGFKF